MDLCCRENMERRQFGGASAAVVLGVLERSRDIGKRCSDDAADEEQSSHEAAEMLAVYCQEERIDA